MQLNTEDSSYSMAEVMPVRRGGGREDSKKTRLLQQAEKKEQNRGSFDSDY